MRISIFVFLLVLVSMFPSEVKADGNKFLTPCRQALQFLEGESAEANYLDAGLCAGFVYGVGELYRDLQHLTVDLTICIPSEVSRAQFLRVFVAFLDAHPEKLHKDELRLITEAFLEAWPCGEN